MGSGYFSRRNRNRSSRIGNIFAPIERINGRLPLKGLAEGPAASACIAASPSFFPLEFFAFLVVACYYHILYETLGWRNIFC